MAWNQNQGGGYNQGGYNRGGYNRGGGDQQRQNMPNSGVLFPRNKKSQNAPDMGGSITISADLLDYIINAARQGEVKIEVSAWRRQSRENINYLSLKAQVPYEIRQQDPAFQQNPTYRPQQNWNRQNNGTTDERAQYGGRQTYQNDRQNDANPPAPNPYADAKGGRYPVQQRQPRQGLSQEEFAKGDRVPDFMREDDDPNAAPF